MNKGSLAMVAHQSSVLHGFSTLAHHHFIDQR